MITDAPRRSIAADHELQEGVNGGGPRVTPVYLAPGFRLRSPILEHRPIELPLPGDDRATVLLPPLRVLIGPAGLAILVAAPVLLVAGWELAIVAGASAALFRMLDGMVGRATFSLGDGFLPYRPETGWPQGVQEEDDVQWNWSPSETGGARPAVRSVTRAPTRQVSGTGAREESRARQRGRRLA